MRVFQSFKHSKSPLGEYLDDFPDEEIALYSYEFPVLKTDGMGVFFQPPVSSLIGKWICNQEIKETGWKFQILPPGTVTSLVQE